MKPILFAKDETDFTTNGLGRLDCISCHVIEERNGMYELEAEIPITGTHASDIEMLSIIGVIPHDGGTIQPFYVYKITKPINGRFTIYARHISYRLSDIPCSPFSISASGSACYLALAGLKSHAIEACPFTFSTDVTTANSYTQKLPASIRQRLGGVEGSILDQFGGEYEWDKFNVKLWNSRGRLANTTGISLRYGKNITDINQEEEIANTVTGIYPYWADSNGDNLVTLNAPVYSSHASAYPYHLTQVLDLSGEFQEKPTTAQLQAFANTYVNKSGFGIPKVNIKVSFINLWETEEYKDIAPLERVQLCDEIYVQFEKLGVSALAKVVKTDYDVLKERYNNIEVGSIRTTLAQAITDRDKDIDTAFIEQLTRINGAISDATAWLTSANGYVVAVKNQDGSWKELLFMNTNDPTTATAGVRINNNGIGFFSKAQSPSGNVLDGPYSTAWTIDGRLGDFANKNFWNFITGEFSLSASTTVGGQTVQQIADAAQTAAEATAAAALATTAEQLQEQIDGQIMTWFYNYDPTTSNAPASTWTTVDEKINHIGDLFYNSQTGYCFRWQVKTTAVDPTHPTANDFEWVQIADEDIAKALQLAGEKRRVFVATPTPPYDIGDLWVQGSTGDIKRCATAKISGQTYSSSDWVLASKYTDDTAVTNLDNSLNQQEVYKRLTNNSNAEGIFLQDGHLYLNASMINTGEMSADRIQGGILTVGGVNNVSGTIRVVGDGVVYDGMNVSAGDTERLPTYYPDLGYMIIGVSSTHSDGVVGRMKGYTDGVNDEWVDLYNGYNLVGFEFFGYIDFEAYYDLSISLIGCKVISTLNKSGIITDYLLAEKGRVGTLKIEDKTIEYQGSSHTVTCLYLESNKVYFHRGRNEALTRTLRKDIYFSPYFDGWTEDSNIYIYFDGGHHEHLSTEVARFTLYKWSGTSWTNQGYRRFNGEGTELDSKNRYFDEMDYDDKSIYRIRIKLTYKSWANYYDTELYTGRQDTVEIDRFGITSEFRGKLTGSAELYGLSVNEVTIDQSNEIVYEDEDTSAKYRISKNGFYSQRAGSYGGYIRMENDVYPQLTIAAPGSSGSYPEQISIHTQGPSIYVADDNTEYILISTTQMYLHASNSDYARFLGYGHGDLYSYYNGSAYEIQWTSSDRRNKENIVDLDAELSKKLIDATEPKKFKYKNSEGTHYGMIAQEAREVLDSLGETDAMLEHGIPADDDSDPRNITYQEYIPHLINYVKELRAVVDRQQAEINELKTIVKKL